MQGQHRPDFRGTLAERHVAKTKKTPTCWLWTGARFLSGYGMIWKEGKQALAHRVAYELAKGPIGPGLYVCHTCDVPSCVNPKHLWLGTREDNWADMRRKGRNSWALGNQYTGKRPRK
jgi:hypothetical protein